jgi:signal transduction histidine kinase
LFPLLEAGARQVGGSLDQMHARNQQRRLAVAEERMRLARDLHDGALQSLTGVRFELQRLWRALADNPSNVTPDRLLAMERTLADEQRGLRLLIGDLKPSADPPAAGSLHRRLGDLCERLSAQWRVPIDLHVDDPLPGLSDPVDHAVVPMVQEAVVNAVKHGDPSRVRVTVQQAGHHLEVVVTDDGRGFEFEGELDHDVLTARRLGPASLRDRLTSLGGHLAIQSSGAGARLRIDLPCGETRS